MNRMEAKREEEEKEECVCIWIDHKSQNSREQNREKPYKRSCLTHTQVSPANKESGRRDNVEEEEEEEEGKEGVE